MPSYVFKLAGVSFAIQIPWPVQVTENYLPFLQKIGSPFEEQIAFSEVDTLPEVSEPKQWVHGAGRTTRNGRPCILRRLSDCSEPYLLELEQSPEERRYLLRTSSKEIPNTMQKVFSMIHLEELLLRHEILLLHSSLIRWQSSAILFSAPSGTGKSTQADLWAAYEQADILNGDRSALRKVHGTWTAFGLPFAGSSEIYRDESAPIRAIVLLSQGPKNQITRLRPARALTKFYAEVTIHYWDKAYVDHALSLILDLLQAVPVYHLSCLPDRGAVELLRDTINEVTV